MQISIHLVANVEVLRLLILSPYWRPSDSRIAAIAHAHFNSARAMAQASLKASIKKSTGA